MSLPTSRHFTIERNADGVYAALAIKGAGAMCNAGIVDLGDQTLIFDTFFTPQAADDLRHAAEVLLGRPVGIVINSHWHDDHVRGNQSFPGARIIATDVTRDLIAERVAANIARYQAEVPAFLAALRERLAAEQDEHRRAELQADLSFGEEVQATLATLQLTPPTETFTGEEYVLDGPARQARLLTYGGGHTASDTVLYLPAERIVFTGDLVVIGEHPLLADGHPEAWPAILDRLGALAIETLMPGHGPLGTRAAIAAMRQYLSDIAALAQQLVTNGATLEQAVETPVPTQYRDLSGEGVFRRNIAFLYQRDQSVAEVTANEN